MNVPIDLVAPSFLARIICGAGRWFPPPGYQRTLFIGSSCADEGTVGFVPGIRLHDVALVLQDAVYNRAQHVAASMIVWEDFSDTLSDDLDILCSERSPFKLVSYPGSIVSLLEGSLAGYLQTLTSAKRYSLKKN
jgi:hypothetical protein